MICYCDLDGVLADFVTGACEHHGVPNPYYISGVRNIEMLGVWDFTNKVTDLTHGVDFWDGLGYDFWLGLDMMPDAMKIILAINTILYDHEIIIATSPSQNIGCMDGKRDWAAAWVPGLDVIPIKRKELLAKPGTLLIDDNDKNCERFRANGGQAILLPRLWNSRHEEACNSTEILIKELRDVRKSDQQLS